MMPYSLMMMMSSIVLGCIVKLMATGNDRYVLFLPLPFETQMPRQGFVMQENHALR
jgi:hypothetical protein